MTARVKLSSKLNSMLTYRTPRSRHKKKSLNLKNLRVSFSFPPFLPPKLITIQILLQILLIYFLEHFPKVGTRAEARMLKEDEQNIEETSSETSETASQNTENVDVSDKVIKNQTKNPTS